MLTNAFLFHNFKIFEISWEFSRNLNSEIENFHISKKGIHREIRMSTRNIFTIYPFILNFISLYIFKVHEMQMKYTYDRVHSKTAFSTRRYFWIRSAKFSRDTSHTTFPKRIPIDSGKRLEKSRAYNKFENTHTRRNENVSFREKNNAHARFDPLESKTKAETGIIWRLHICLYNARII